VFSEKCEEAEGASRRYIGTTFVGSGYGKWAGCRQLERTRGSWRRHRQPHARAAGQPALRGARRDHVAAECATAERVRGWGRGGGADLGRGGHQAQRPHDCRRGDRTTVQGFHPRLVQWVQGC
jgi:hypothetical protein